MNCPKCGLQTLPAQKFCRSCGSSLEMATQRLNDLPAASYSQNEPPVTAGKQDPANRLILWGFVIMLIGVAIGVIGKMLVHQDLVTVVGVLVSLVGMFLTVYPYLSPSPRNKHDSRLSDPPEVLNQTPAMKSLPHESPVEYIPSVVERTTDLLEHSKSNRSGKQEDETLRKPGGV